MRRPLDGVEILEYGDRIAVSACGSVLLALGARVSCVAPDDKQARPLPSQQTEGKQRLHDGDRVREAWARADIVIASSDLTPLTLPRSDAQIACDITAYGTSGPLAGVPHSDALVQAMSGLADTTGEPDGPPLLSPFPQTEGIAALYAAAGILAAWLVRMRTGLGQTIEIALFDCAFSTLSTFLPFHFTGKPITRSGNRHVLASPWNAYRARDGWLLICTGTDEQWRRLCEVIGRHELARDSRLAKAADRLHMSGLVDGAVQDWIARLRAADAVDALQARGIAAGPVAPVASLEHEPNIAHRGLYTPDGMRSAIRCFGEAGCAQRGQVSDGEGGIPAEIPPPPSVPLPEGEGSSTRSRQDSPLPPREGLGGSAGVSPTMVRAGRTASACMPMRALQGRGKGRGAWPPLAGLKVLEIGQYTTAPLVARNLGALGAEVLKIEPPGGDAARGWPPQQDGQGYFFTLSNSDKRSVCLDLRSPADRSRFASLLRDADVLVENLKPGSLDKLGFDAAERNRINPALVYCAISGFGADSAYPGRPAFDTVVQAMSGIMDSIRASGVPQKTGISLADILGGLFALTGTLGALVRRESTGMGDALDISMQDAAAWITQWQRARLDGTREALVVRCADGHIVVEALTKALAEIAHSGDATRAALVQRLGRCGVAAAAVLSVAEVAESDQARERALLRRAHDSAGRKWPLFPSPVRLQASPSCTQTAIGPLGEAGDRGFGRAGWSPESPPAL
jgi:crotonobetainyl-CoA:carnitine CoA-transferase CaiB-like acyl-CoA transferase